jgi:S1-C subfamily serine protease
MHPPSRAAGRRASSERTALFLLLTVALLVLLALSLLLVSRSHGIQIGTPKLPPGETRQVAERLLPSVVDIQVRGGGVENGRIGIGTGIVFTDCLILTNDHVITGEGDMPADDITVTVDGGDRYEATLVGRDPKSDLALLSVAAEGLQPAAFAPTSDGLSPGSPVVAIGAPHLLPDPVAAGQVTDVRRRVTMPARPQLDRLLETSAHVRPGYSGGPLVDREGRVLGVNVGAAGAGTDGVHAYAIPSELALDVAAEIIAREGVACAPATVSQQHGDHSRTSGPDAHPATAGPSVAHAPQMPASAWHEPAPSGPYAHRLDTAVLLRLP